MHNKIEENYASKFSMSDPSIVSSGSSNSQRYSDSPLGASDIGQFDIIDDLDYDDVDDGLIVDQELMYQYRQAIINQVYEGEKQYLETLSTIIDTYLTPLRKSLKTTSFNFLGIKKAPCTEKEIGWLFNNVEDIYKLHLGNLSMFSERLNIWGPTQIISDIVQTRLTAQKEVYNNYFNRYDIMVTTFERLSRYQPFKKYIESIDKNAKGTTVLLSLLQSPLKSIAHTRELFKSLSDNTSPMHPDYIGLMQCKNRIVSIYSEFIPKLEDAQNVNKVYQIQVKLSGQPFGVKTSRRLILQDSFTKSNRLTNEDTVYFLFTDILVFAKQKSNSLQYKGHIILDRTKVRAAPNNNDFSVEVMCPYQGVDSLNSTFMSSPSTHVIRTSSRADQLKWITNLETVISKLEQKQSR
ncbi:Dbl homology domain-containing protein [Helicostylum pulchrum]|nr:Dbl homology domain-containing protein [Helicostylum pulchrum]